jgi:prophage antirepressor-like protein
MNLTQFQFERQDIRFVVINNEVYFVAKDIANVLGYQDTAHAIRDHIDKEDTLTDIELTKIAKEFSHGHFDVVKRAIYTNESGVYGLIFGSTKPEAKKFKRWLTKEVLPSIRKTGSYSVEQPKKAITVYSDRIMDLEKNLVKQPNTWCIAEKANYLMLRVEKLGYPIDIFDLLDGSVGSHWSKYRSSKEWAVESSTADYHLDNHRGTRVIKAYDFCELGYFAQWLETIYVPLKMPVYLLNKYGALAKA